MFAESLQGESSVIEVEAKFDIIGSEPDAIEALLTWIQRSGYSIDPVYADRQILDVYYDSNDFSLRRHQASMRIRSAADQVLVTFKRKVRPGQGLLQRRELEAPPSVDHLSRIQLELRAMGLADEGLPAQHPLIPEKIFTIWGLEEIIRIHNSRAAYSISIRSQQFCTLVLDRVLFSHGDRSTEYRGVELEALEPIHQAQVAELAEAIAKSLPGHFVAQSRSKYDMGLERLGLG